MLNFEKIISDTKIKESLYVINKSFLTVAEEFNLTEENSPSNPAFINFEKLKESINNGLKLYAIYCDNEITGTIGIEKSKDNDDIYYLERLAVLPGKRHCGYGRRLLDYAIEEIKKVNGKKVSIGIINENSILKKWYSDYGFSEVRVKKYDHLLFDVCFMELTV